MALLSIVKCKIQPVSEQIRKKLDNIKLMTNNCEKFQINLPKISSLITKTQNYLIKFIRMTISLPKKKSGLIELTNALVWQNVNVRKFETNVIHFKEPTHVRVTDH